MTSRCRNKNATGFSDYGGRGIRVCDSWINYENFYNWAISNGYNDELTIDRINNDGNYEPDNCKWATVQEQARNKRNTVRINGVSLRDIAEEKGFNPELAIERHYRGVTEEGLFIEGYLPRNQFKEAKR
ncbi:HNH endonuclease [Bacillus phage 1_ICo-2020]|uniref:HNH endonuclease n=1 Tax=Bacillus phage 1_ICo-2020 TaxID=2759272 RepID=A0A7G8AKF9_9CAUD|nr:HNH endonuclease [Bacillus phage 1_ICo-2020]